jgi:hypothetical protein
LNIKNRYIFVLLLTTKTKQMKTLEIVKLQRVENPDAELLSLGIVAFQLVKISYSFYGKLLTNTFDTKIMSDGSQIVIDGDGFLKSGYQL